MSLNRYQRNAVLAEMMHLERALLGILTLLKEPQEGSMIRRRPVAERVRAEVETLVGRALEEIRAVAAEFELPPQTEDAGRQIVATASVAWSDLYDLLSDRLDRYGDVDPGLAVTLDPHVRRLIELVERMQQVASGKP
jgi:hypothetical protein